MKKIVALTAALLLSSSFAFADESIQNNDANAVKPMPSDATKLASDDSMEHKGKEEHHKHHKHKHKHHHEVSSTTEQH